MNKYERERERERRQDVGDNGDGDNDDDNNTNYHCSQHGYDDGHGKDIHKTTTVFDNQLFLFQFISQKESTLSLNEKEKKKRRRDTNCRGCRRN